MTCERAKETPAPTTRAASPSNSESESEKSWRWFRPAEEPLALHAIVTLRATDLSPARSLRQADSWSTAAASSVRWAHSWGPLPPGPSLHDASTTFNQSRQILQSPFNVTAWQHIVNLEISQAFHCKTDLMWSSARTLINTIYRASILPVI